ncbi:MAG: homocysteine S-methyltransferase family protein [Lachnospiraceae bacterium]
MTRNELKQMIKKHPIFLDGATGSNLQKAGMPTGVCPELWIIEHREILIKLQRDFKKAGTNIVYAPTFSGNSIKLAEYGLENRLDEINKTLVQISREAVGSDCLVAGDMTMTGESLSPIGSMTLERLVDIYKEQATSLYEAGVDLFVVETMMSLAETRAAVLAIKEVCDLPIIASMSFEEDGRTLYGTSPAAAVTVLQSLGVDVVGVNCSTGPKEMVEIVKQMQIYSKIPILAKPNAGLPKIRDGKTVYDMTPDQFASYAKDLVEAGASFLGGCCGTTPAHIKKLVDAAKDLEVKCPNPKYKSVLSSERNVQEIVLGENFLTIGERINPTGKKKLQQELREGSLELVKTMAEEQEELGAHILDINMGTNGIDEKEMMLKAIDEVGLTTSLPLCIDTSHVDIMEAALFHYPGRALINSVSLETEKIEKALPLVKKYGAMVILLPLSSEGLPKSKEEKEGMIHTLVEKALEIGISKDDLIIDGLVQTVGANKRAAIETLETIKHCTQDLKIPTVVGLSNISFGLPQRKYVNAAFGVMAVQNGLTMAIANPSSDLLHNVTLATDLLLNKPESDLAYIEGVREEKLASSKSVPIYPIPAEKRNHSEEKKEEFGEVFKAVLNGKRNEIIKKVENELKNKVNPSDIMDMLIAAIGEVGERFDKKIYFLPQLISSAETMKKAIEYLEPLMQVDGETSQKTTIVIATVEGDIHDIGKNLVALMLKNYGYNVIDLGKDVKAEIIIETAKKENASIIVLSALMTTTMMRMKEVVELKNKNNLDVKIMIGGAVTTPSFAQEIGADGYSKDAQDAVKLADRLMNKTREQK